MPEDALLTLRLPSRPEAAAAARTALAALNGDLHLISAPRLADAQLLLSELVTNAVRHGGSDSVATVIIHMAASRDCIRIEVSDRGAGFAPASITRPPSGEPGGRGLFVVDAIADRWGTARHERHCVWLERRR